MAEKKKTKEMYLVVWDDGGDDPVQKCSSFKQAEDKVKDLIADGIQAEDIQVYKVIQAYKIKLELVKI